MVKTPAYCSSLLRLQSTCYTSRTGKQKGSVLVVPVMAGGYHQARCATAYKLASPSASLRLLVPRFATRWNIPSVPVPVSQLVACQCTTRLCQREEAV